MDEKSRSTRRKLIRAGILLILSLAAAMLLASCSRGKTLSPDRVHADGAQIVRYFTDPNGCKAYAGKDRKEGNTVVLETVDASEDPFIWFGYEEYVRSLGFDPVSADDYKFIILKLRQEDCTGSEFELFFAAGAVSGAQPGHSRTAVFDNTSKGWQYLIFDLSGDDFHGTVHGFRFDFIRQALKGGEKVHIASMTFLKNSEDVAAFMAKHSEPDPHLLTKAQENEAKALLDTVKPDAVPNDKLTAEYEDPSLSLWFDHTYTKTPAESTVSTGLNSYKMYLAKNEIEDCQFLLASDVDRTGLTAELGGFTNTQGNKLRAELYYGWYFDDVQGQSIVDPTPRLEGPFDLAAGRSQLFLIKLYAGIDAVAGDYSAELRIIDADGRELKKAKVYAYVYDFALPEATTCKTQMDLSWYAVYVNHELYEGDDGVLYKKYYDLLLENRICAYTLPYSDRGAFADPRVQEYVANPRVVAFNPIGWKVDPTADNVSAAYRYLSQNPEWLKKAYFYVVDEPLTMEALDRVNYAGKLIADNFPGYHYIVPMHYDIVLSPDGSADSFEYVKQYVNAWCPHNYFFNTYADYLRDPLLTYRMSSLTEKALGTFPERMAREQKEGDEVWWYVTRYPQKPEITVSIETQALRLRILFWQQKLYGIDHFLYYLVNDWFPARDAEGNPDFGWNSKHETASGYTAYDIYGNGVLVYAGHYIGVEEPVGSLRLECIRDGIEDFEYLTLFEQLYGSEKLELIIKQITTSLGRYTTDEELFTAVRVALGKLIEGK
ncbi:MAG: DUF4091 domain-containing protein [Clostridia bacterium]|nr:DUF4091 domain-containing protein [Clostridia bacterium]